MFNLFSKLGSTKLLGLAVLGLALHAAPAAAVDYTFNVGDLPTPSPYTQSVFHAPSSFADIFNFNLVNGSDVSGASVSLQLTLGPLNLLHIDNPTVTLYNTVNPFLALASGSTSFNVSNINVGSYFVRVTGDANGVAGGQYLFGLSAIPVPEPEQWMLFVAGLMAVGSIAHRRSKV